MNALFRADASLTIGAGHVMRCLALAQGLRKSGWNCEFVSRTFEGHLGDAILAQGFNFHRLTNTDKARRSTTPKYPHEPWLGVDWKDDVAEMHNTIGRLKTRPDWIVVDHYGIDRRWEAAFQSEGHRLLVIDDLADREHAADILVDQNYYVDYANRYGGLVPAACSRLLGPHYALLRHEFQTLRASVKPRNGVVRRILVFFGGSDPARQTLKAISALRWTEKAGVWVDVVVGGSNPLREDIRRECESRRNITFHCQIDTMAALMAKTDLALVAGGSVTWELACMGVPACLMVTADNQRRLVQDMASRGLAVAITDPQIAAEELESAVRCLAEDGTLLRSMSDGLMQSVDGHGVERIGRILSLGLLHLRPATPEDSRMLWQWANDPDVRSASFSSNAIAWETHQAWFEKKLCSLHVRIWIATDESGQPVGQIRFECEDDGEATIGISVDSRRRGQGIAPLIIDKGVALAQQAWPLKKIHAWVKANNPASAKSFIACGFSEYEKAEVQGSEAVHLLREIRS